MTETQRKKILRGQQEVKEAEIKDIMESARAIVESLDTTAKPGRPKGEYGPYNGAKEKSVVSLSFRLAESDAEKLGTLQHEDESLNQAARRLLLEALRSQS